ncbi:MAG: DNA-directed RNA polymerase subunit beta' [Chloroflexota bacterium]|nr:DNA-directed RNA polymerase subunit beta' [Chloroflexota bacterium]
MELNEIKSLRLSLASPEQIRSWSYGEVTEPETINYRRLRPEKDGLFCEAIFGPTKDWQCACGKYKGVRYRGIICDKCGVEVTHSRVRRERMGHIELAAPVAHIWYTRRSPSYLALLLNISRRKLDRVLYFAKYIITSVDEKARERALHHREDEMNDEVARLEEEKQDELSIMEAQLGQIRDAADEKEAEIREDIEQRLEEATEAVMDEATRLREVLDQYRGEAAPETLVFSPTGATVVKEGETIQREDIGEFNEIVQEELTRLEEKFSLEQERLLEPLQHEREAAAHKLEEYKERLQEELFEKSEAVRERFEKDKEELVNIKVKQRLNETQYRELQAKWGRVFEAGMGAEAVLEIISNMNLEELVEQLREQIRTETSKQRKKKAIKRLRFVRALIEGNNRPEWMILQVLPVIPPALRPMVQLDGGRFATSDLNDLYRRVINRNNRLKHLLELQAPEVIVRNEKRMLQEAVDSLIDNSRQGKAVSLHGRRQLKSLSDMLKGKQGRFRRNLLGKRVDYSGRSVIVVGPDLEMHECGLPRRMALELFRPFVMQKLVEYAHAINVKGAKRLIERETPEVWEVLEEVIKTRPVLLNRAPTLHRLGIQAFEPVLVEGNAIQLHPLVCAAFNADFDGDQMAVHVPLSEAAVKECREIMLSTRNQLKPANGEPLVAPTKDMVLGSYYLTMEEEGVKGEGKAFSSFEEVQMAYELGFVHVHAKIKFAYTPEDSDETEVLDTTVGRVLFNSYLPPELRFVNRAMDKGAMRELTARAYKVTGPEHTAKITDRLKDMGFDYAMLSGVTMAIDDIHVPEEKAQVLAEAEETISEVERQYRRGLITEDERYARTIDVWSDATERVTRAVARSLDPHSALGIMVDSGASKGGLQPIGQLAGMRGLMADPSGRIIDLPIRSNFREGLNSLEYFISTSGARKGLADTALRTADAGYLTRRLVDVAQGVIITEDDCGTSQGIWITREGSEEIGEPFAERIAGRFVATPVVDPDTGEILVDVDEEIDEEMAQMLEESAIDSIHVRSPLTCSLRHGICRKCYGRDLARGSVVDKGVAVGVIAAQSIGEPGTQLTLRTFHTGGVAGASDITQGLPRVEELFEARDPQGQAVISEIDGRVSIESRDGKRTVRVVSTDVQRVEHDVPGNYSIKVEDGDSVEKGDLLGSRKGQEDVLAEVSGRVSMEDGHIVILHEEKEERTYHIRAGARLRVQDGDMIEAGEMITEGSKNPHQILSILGIEALRDYMITEVQKVYRSQGVAIHDKHIEVVVRQMLRYVEVTSSGDSELLPGELVDRVEFEELNTEIIEEGGEPATAEPVILGITKGALSTESFLSAASFQHTIKVLANAAVEGKVDPLHGLKENVLIGKLIPVGTGFRPEEEEAAEEAEREEEPVLEPLNADFLGGFGADTFSESDVTVRAGDTALMAQGGDSGEAISEPGAEG